MISLKIPVRATLAAALAAISLTSLGTYARTPEPPGLFSELPVTTRLVPPKQALAGKTREVKIDKDKLRKGRFFVSLPGGVSYEAVRDSQEDHGKGRSSWTGHADDDPDSTIILGISGDAVAGTFLYQGKMFKLEPRANGRHVLSEVKTTDPRPELDPIPVADTTSGTSSGGAGTAVSADANGSIIDVLVAFTPAVQALYGAEGANALILQAVAETNQIYANSGMATRMNLVRSVMTNYAESGDMNTDLSRLRSTNDGYMDELHTLRNTYGADVVNLIENGPQYCGLAYRMATLSSGFASSAFSVVHYGCATGYYSFAHEIGHNQGAHHDAGNATSAAIFPYAYGYQAPNAVFRTVMAYDCPGGCPRIPNFSNAEILRNGVPTGVVGYAENADTIENTAATVASFRQSSTPVVPTAPSGLSVSASGSSQIDLNWTDQSSNESGFVLERSGDGANFTQIASLAANANSYRDGSLVAETVYYYRVKAWNSTGNSLYSNVAFATTAAPPQYLEQFISSESSTAGTVSGTYKDTWSVGGARESITEILSAGTKKQRYSYLEHYWAIQVQPGKAVTLSANVATNAGTTQSFTFAYSTFYAGLAANPTGWIDMFTVSASNPGVKQFTLPASSPSGWFFISVRDNKRAAGVTTRDSVQVDYLTVRTE